MPDCAYAGACPVRRARLGQRRHARRHKGQSGLCHEARAGGNHASGASVRADEDAPRARRKRPARRQPRRALYCGACEPCLRFERHARMRGCRCGAESGLFPGGRLLPGRRLREEIHLHRISRSGGCHHRLLQAQDARHDGSDKRRQELFWRHSRHNEAGIPL